MVVKSWREKNIWWFGGNRAAGMQNRKQNALEPINLPGAERDLLQTPFCYSVSLKQKRVSQILLSVVGCSRTKNTQQPAIIL